MFKKLLASLLVTIVLFSSFLPLLARPASAAWYDQGPLEFSQKVFDTSNNDIFGERYTFAQVGWIMNSLIIMIAGGDLAKLAAQFEEQQKNPELPYNIKDVKIGGTFGVFAQVLSFFYQEPPASGTYWVSQTLDKFNIIPAAYAQSPGFGFNTALKMFLPAWRGVRNLAYLIMIVFVLVTAFAIMFRAKINPQTVVSLQSALPKIVITIILITFSYAIAGFLIDLMYAIFAMVAFAFDQFGVFPAGSVLSGPNRLNDFLTADVVTWFFTAVVFGLIFIILGVVAAVAAPASFGATAAFAPLLLALGIGIIVFFGRIVLMLAQTYISLAINVIFAPLILSLEAIPQISGRTFGWIKSIIADVLVFLAVGLLFMIGSLLGDIINYSAANGAPVWHVPFLGSHKWLLQAIIQIGMLSIIPNVRGVVYQFMQKKGPEIEFPREFSGVGERASRGVQEYIENRRKPFPLTGGGSGGATTGGTS